MHVGWDSWGVTAVVGGWDVGGWSRGWNGYGGVDRVGVG